METFTRARVITAISVVMLGLGVFVALRPFWSTDGPLTDSWWLDGGFAFFFIVRGAVGVRAASRRRPGVGPTE